MSSPVLAKCFHCSAAQADVERQAVVGELILDEEAEAVRARLLRAELRHERAVVVDHAVRVAGRARERQPRSHLGGRDRAVAVGVELRVELRAVRRAVDRVDQAVEVARVVDVEVAPAERAGRQLACRQTGEAGLQRRHELVVDVDQIAEVDVARPLQAALERVAVPGVLQPSRARPSVSRWSMMSWPKPPSCSSVSVRTSVER